MINLHRLLDKNEFYQILDIASLCLEVNDISKLKDCLLKIQDLFSYHHAFCSFTNLKELATSKNPEVEIVDLFYPEGLLDHYFQSCYNVTDPVVQELFKTQDIQDWNLSFEKNGLHYPSWAIDLGIKNGLTHICLDPDSSTAATFSLNQVEPGHRERTKAILRYLTPHLSIALKHYLGINRVNNIRLKSILSSRELEVLTWIKQGKTSWEISIILNISERTVIFHTSNILIKLNATNRAHAVALAFDYKIIEP